MADRAGLQPLARAQRGRAYAFITGEVAGQHVEIAGIIDDRHIVPKEIMITLPGTDAAVQHQRIAQIILTIERPEGILGTRLAPALRIVVAHMVGTGHAGIGADLNTLLRRIGITLGMPHIGRQPQAFAAEIRRSRPFPGPRSACPR